MRELKFRAWDKKDKKMWYCSLNTLRTALGFDYGLEDNVMAFAFDGKLKPCMQFTGLKDKNGKDIYEGDVIALDRAVIESTGSKRPTCLVGFKDGSFMCGRGEIATFMDTYLWMVSKYCEVFGNVYENPELLEVSK